MFVNKLQRFSLAAAMTGALFGSHGFPAAAGTSIWSGGGADENWSTPQNWSPLGPPSNDGTTDITMAGSVGTAPQVDVSWSINSLKFSALANAFTISGSALTIGSGGITNQSSANQTVNNSITLGSNQSWSSGINVNYDLLMKGAVNTNGHSLTITGSGGGLLQGAISGSGSVVMGASASGEFNFSGTNTYSGGTFFNSGIFFTNSDQSLGSAGTPITFNGGTLYFGSPATIDHPITLNAAGGTIRAALAQNQILEISSNIQGPGALTIAQGGAAYLELTGNNTYSGGTVVNEFTLLGTTSSIQGNISLEDIYSQVQFQQNFNGTYAGNISGGGEVLVEGTGIMALTGNNTYSSDTQLYNGVLQVNSGSNGLSPSSRLIFEGGGGVIQFVGPETFTRAINTANTNGGVVWNGAGGFSALNGKLTVNIGGSSAQFNMDPIAGSAMDTLVFGSPTANSETEFQNPIFLGNSLSTPNPVIQVNAGAGGDYALLSGRISGANALSKTGNGTLVLAAANTYTGSTTVSAGTLTISGSLAKTAVTVQGGASLGGTGSITGSVTVAGGSTSSAQGSINLVDNAFGTIILSDPSSADTVLTLGGSSGKPSLLDMEVGSSADNILISAGKLLVQAGGTKISITPITGFQPGTYSLIEFPTGQASGLTNLSLATTTLPGGYSLSLRSTSTAEQLVVAVPEPSTVAILGLGAASLLTRRKRKRAF